MPEPAEERASQVPSLFGIGEVLGEAYEIRALLGQGGMGQVFDAYDRNLSRRVAIKANFPEVPQSVRNEAQALAAVHHPGVVGVYALGTHGGVDYMVMEHVAGVTLAHHLERLEDIPLAERVDLLIAIADGLAAIHRAGISHGDVKPENILLSASGRLVLTDPRSRARGLRAGRRAHERHAGLHGAGDHLAQVRECRLAPHRRLRLRHPRVPHAGRAAPVRCRGRARASS